MQSKRLWAKEEKTYLYYVILLRWSCSYSLQQLFKGSGLARLDAHFSQSLCFHPNFFAFTGVGLDPCARLLSPSHQCILPSLSELAASPASRRTNSTHTSSIQDILYLISLPTLVFSLPNEPKPQLFSPQPQPRETWSRPQLHYGNCLPPLSFHLRESPPPPLPFHPHRTFTPSSNAAV